MNIHRARHISRGFERFVFALTLIGLLGCATRTRNVATTSEADAVVQSAGFYEYWDARLPLRDGDELHQSYLVDENLYVVSRDGEWFTLDAATGLLRWKSVVASPEYRVYPPSHLLAPDGHGPLALVTTEQITLHDRYSGDIVYRWPLGFAPGGGAIGDQNAFIMGSADGQLYSMAWRNRFGIRPIERWHVVTNGPVTTSPVWAGHEEILFASQGGTVARCSAVNKAYGWTFRAEGAIIAQPVWDATGVYIASADRSLYRLNPDNGSVLKRFRFPAPLRDAPVVVGFTCFQYCPGEGMSALDVTTGARKWSRADVQSLIAGGDGEVAVLTDHGAVEIADVETGRTVRGFGVAADVFAAQNTSDKSLYLLQPDGRVRCIRPEGTPYLRRQEIESARAYLERSGPPAAEPVGNAPVAATRSGDPFRSRLDSPR